MEEGLNIRRQNEPNEEVMSQKEIKSQMDEIRMKISPLIQDRKSLQNDIDVNFEKIKKFVSL